MRRQPFGVITQFGGGGRLPMIRAQHWTEVVERFADPALRIQTGAILPRSQAQVQRVFNNQSRLSQPRQQRIRGALQHIVRTCRIHDQVHRHCRRFAFAGAPSHPQLLPLRLYGLDAAGVHPQLAIAAQAGNEVAHLRGNTVPVRVPVCPQMPQEAPLLRGGEPPPQRRRQVTQEGDGLAPVASFPFDFASQLARHRQ